MQADEQIYTYRIARKVRTGGSSFASGFFTLVGIACMLLVPWIVGVPAGLILLAIAYFTDAKTKCVSTCGHCGNEVAHTSQLGPTCHADLAPEPRSAWSRLWR